MGKYLKSFNSHSEYLQYIQSNDRVLPNVSYCINENEVYYNPSWAENYLTFVALESGAISFNIGESVGTDMITSISYSTDNGETWTTVQNQDDKSENLVISVNVNTGDNILWKGIATQLSSCDNDYISCFRSTCRFDAKGNIMSLLYGDNFKNQYTIEEDSVFYLLFGDDIIGGVCMLVNAKDLVLSATTLTSACYSNMFAGCVSLITAPKLPATELASDCYSGMFYTCTSLITAPELPATTLADSCYIDMFDGCTSLTTPPKLPATTLVSLCYDFMFGNCTALTIAPELPATTLAGHCYQYMFNGCTSLTSAPELPATTLTNYCYFYMFSGCTGLTTASELPATTLAEGCYDHMFNGCTSLNYIKAMFTTTPSNTYTDSWVSGVASTGTFVKNSAALWNVTGNNGIPNNWTVETA